ncbi:asparagine synthase (glutamine-hydrolyzing) [Flavobacteriaceae bacterium TP-CH-4]|uniref:asparagine synthase (glutamine-hydrolyzing) n=1 Tax=Pelagihabitans pacificus TaxID=2696054 RepID=A0A967EFL4_9FLAO|nr:asparagine synthase (glutamine-hydrolyzing) [Pelagihabitans pacificus]NHF61533.1 asparagine synthase (glutamine-hydrolyzing) [Pelagihabitans pacificus]
MCGIYGTTIPYSAEEVKSKLERIAFRGPDQSGSQLFELDNGQVILGHNRLSIIDLDKRSNQPFTYNDNIHIVFNGEIYNFRYLKKILEQKGYLFKTTSDTEVICAAYLEYGKDCVSHLNGMFAFVIFDQAQQILFGARDRLGQKPFYYYHAGKNFEFASQVSSIQQFNDKLSISKDSISQYLSWGYVPDPFTIFNEVKKLRAGHVFTFRIKTGEFESNGFWDIDYKATSTFPGTYEEAQTELERLISDSVKLRLFADVPVGVFLSGGIDSSLVTALATKTTAEKVKTFSVKFNKQGFDESQFASKVADYLNTEHHVIECDYGEGLNLIDSFSYYYDEPFADASAIPSMLLSKYTKNHVTVALSGDAGDEAFIGYHRYNWMSYIEKAFRAPSRIRLAFAYLLKKVPYYKLQFIGSIMGMKDINLAYLSTVSGLNSTWANGNTDTANLVEAKYLYHTCKNIYERVSDFDIKTYLNSDINTKVDRASMAYSLEIRSPLMDYRIIEFSRMLPTDFKFQKGNQKRILKDVLYRHVPKTFFERPKSGFTMPFKEWFRNELKDYVLSELNDTGLRQIPSIDQQEVKSIINMHMTAKANNYPIIWRLLILKQWLKNNARFALK